MAEKIAVVESFLSCHVCSETFRDPVSLSCSHSFCSSCLQRFWEQAGNKNCPICKNRIMDQLRRHQRRRKRRWCVKNIQKSLIGSVRTSRKLCVLSVSSLSTRVTRWFLLEQAVRNLKDQLRSDLESLEDKRDKHQQVEKKYNQVIQLSKEQLVSTERKIRAEFNKLHQFLREEEESRLAALREEEEQKGKTISREMKMIEEQISSLSDSISAVEEDLQKDNVSFLSSYKATQTRARVQSSLTDPQLVSGALIDVAKHLGNLSFRVWEKMKDQVHFSPVILDPNTADYDLYLSDDLTSVRCGDTNQQLPDNPERFTWYAEVLGSEGFSSGKHSWEVEVGDHPYWFVGLVKESVNRKGERGDSPKHGVWCLVHQSGKYTNGAGQTVRVKKSLQRIRVQLDYDRGDVSFYDPEDMTHICTHRDTFTEKLFPWFSVGESDDAKTADIKICQTDVSL
uniref:Uncharacterized protein n=1 Tax=Gasterosteus aculeatus aculeatus TaxID=481459 RepID=A0AAQ4RYZ3_GASAC